MKKEEKTRISREKILSAALQEFGTNGFRGTTVNAICGGHGIAKGLLYHNFSGKGELFLLCVKKCFSSLLDYLYSRGDEPDLKQCLRLRARFFQENPLYAGIFFEALLQPPADLQQKILEIQKDFREFNRKLYLRVISGLTLREGISGNEALEYCELMQDMFNCYFSSPACSGRSLPELMEEHESRLEKILDFMLYGIAREQKV